MVVGHRAFLDLLEPVYNRLSRYAMAITRDEMDAEDLVSATVLAALERFDVNDVHEQFLHYLIKIASRLHKRGRYRERNRATYDEATALLLRDNSPLPDTSAELRLVMDALNTLPEKMRETVVLFDVSDLSLEEIRKIQGGTLSGVKTRLKRGRERIARALDIVPLEAKTPVTTPKPENLNHFAIAQERYV
jgi:RNA polymerase sigma-70 factor (ECF subfamily)